MNLPKIERDNDTLWLLQDLSGMGVYDKAKAIVNFCDKETKLFEKEIDRAILEIFEKNGIEIPNTDKSVLKLAFDLLKAKGTDIEIVDAFKDTKIDNCEFVKLTKNQFTVVLEDSRYIQCCVRIKEKNYEKICDVI